MTVSVDDRCHLQRILSVSNDSTNMILAGPSLIVPHIAGTPSIGNHDIMHNLYMGSYLLVVFLLQILSFSFYWLCVFFLKKYGLSKTVLSISNCPVTCILRP